VAARRDGNLFWYRHTDYETGVTAKPAKKKLASSVSATWEGPVQIGQGWQGYLALIALLPATVAIPA